MTSVPVLKGTPGEGKKTTFYTGQKEGADDVSTRLFKGDPRRRKKTTLYTGQKERTGDGCIRLKGDPM